MSNKWDTGSISKCSKGCDYSDNYESAKLYITPKIQAVIRRLCDEIKMEWQILLMGKPDEHGNMVCDGYFIPKQEVTHASVKNLDCIDQAFIDQHNIVATVHSHSDMSCFFSPTDEEMTNNSSPLLWHVVVNNKGDSKAVYKFVLPCGMITMLDTKVSLLVPPTEEFELEGMENIEKRAYPLTQYGGGHLYSSEYHRHGWRNGDDDDDGDFRDLFPDKKTGGNKKNKKKKHALKRENAHIYTGGD